jgi:S1-C subfamily serine protease
MAPRLGIALDEQNQKLRITGFAKDSASEKAGLKIGDTLVSLDGYPASRVEDLRIVLFYKHPGETIKVKAKRGDEEMEFNVKMQ